MTQSTSELLAAQKLAREIRETERIRLKAVCIIQKWVRRFLATQRLARTVEKDLFSSKSHKSIKNYLKFLFIRKFYNTRCSKLKSRFYTDDETLKNWHLVVKALLKSPLECQVYSPRLATTLCRVICTADISSFLGKTNTTILTSWIMVIYRCITPSLWKNQKFPSDEISLSNELVSSDISQTFFSLLFTSYSQNKPLPDLQITAILKIIFYCTKPKHVALPTLRTPGFTKNPLASKFILKKSDDYIQDLFKCTLEFKRCTSEEVLFTLANIITLIHQKPKILNEITIKTIYALSHKIHRKKVAKKKSQVAGQTFCHPLMGQVPDCLSCENEVYEIVQSQLLLLSTSTVLNTILQKIMIIAECLPEVTGPVYDTDSSVSKVTKEISNVFKSWKDKLQKSKTKSKEILPDDDEDGKIYFLFERTDINSNSQISENDVDLTFFICAIFSSLIYTQGCYLA